MIQLERSEFQIKNLLKEVNVTLGLIEDRSEIEIKLGKDE